MRSLLLALLAAACTVPEPADNADDSAVDTDVDPQLPILGPGLGNLDYTAEEAFTVVGWVDGEHGIPTMDPDAPITFGRPYGTNVVAMHDGYLVVIFAPDSGFGPGGFLLIDVSNPRDPQVVTTMYEPLARTSDLRESHSIGFSHLDGRKYMVVQTGLGVAFWDLTDPTSPERVGELALPGVFFGDYAGVAWQLFWQGRYVWVAGAEQGVFLVDASDPTQPVLADRGGAPNPIPATELGGFRVGPLFAVGNLLVASSMDNRSGFATVDISDPLQPSLIGHWANDDHDAYATCLGGGRLFNANRGGDATVVSYDLADPYRVTRVDSGLVVPSQLYCAPQDDHLFLGAQEEVVKVDVSDPSAPVVIGRGSLGRLNPDHGQVTPLGNLVYIGNDHGTGSGLLVHDPAPDVRPPRLVASDPADGATLVARSGRVGLVFSDMITVESVHRNHVVVRTEGGAPVPGRFTVQGNIVSFEPDAPFAAGSTLTVTLPAGGVSDWAGNTLADEEVVSFTIADASSDGAIPDLLVYWPMDEGHGSVATDASGGGRGALLLGGAALTDEGLELDGVSGTARVDRGDLPAEGPRTVTLWVRTSQIGEDGPDSPDAWAQGEAWVDATTATVGWSLGAHHGRAVAYVGGTDVLRSSAGLDDNAWHHVALRRGADGQHDLWVDGAQVDALTSTPPSPAALRRLDLGSFDGADGYAQGTLRDVRVYGRWLDDAELEAVRDGSDQGTRLRARLEPVQVEAGAPATLQLNVRGPGELISAWSFGDGTPWQTSTDAASTVHTWTEPGHYQVVATVTNGTQRVSASAQVTVYAPIVGLTHSSSTVVIDDASRTAWVVLPDHDAVAEVDLDSASLRGLRPTCAEPRSVALDAEGVPWVACAGDDIVAPVVGEVAAYVLPFASRPVGLVHDGTRLWVTLDAASQLVGLGDNNVVVNLHGRPGGLAVDADGRLWVSRFVSTDEGGEVYVYDPATEQLVTHLLQADRTTLDGEDRSRGVPNLLAPPVPTPDGTQVWVPTTHHNIFRGGLRDGQALTFETTVRSVVARLGTDGSTGARHDLNNRAPGVAMALSPLGDWAFVVAQGSHRVEILDAFTGDPVGALLDAGHAPDGVALTAAGDLAVVSGNLSRTVEIYDTRALVDGTGLATPKRVSIPLDAPEPLDADVLLGKQIFYEALDPRVNRDGYISCATCHPDGGHDGRTWDFTDRGEGLRNTIDLRGKAGTGQGPLHWSANFDEVQDFENDIRGAFGGRGYLDQALWEAGTRSDALGDAKAGWSPSLDALAAYVSSLDLAPTSPWRGPDDDVQTWPGATLFTDLGCAACHGGPAGTVSDGTLFDVGTLTAASGGRRGGPLLGLDVPGLRGLWASPPYLHDGSAPTVRDVLTTANAADAHGAISPLSESSVDDLVAYLLALD